MGEAGSQAGAAAAAANSGGEGDEDLTVGILAKARSRFPAEAPGGGGRRGDDDASSAAAVVVIEAGGEAAALRQRRRRWQAVAREEEIWINADDVSAVWPDSAVGGGGVVDGFRRDEGGALSSEDGSAAGEDEVPAARPAARTAKESNRSTSEPLDSVGDGGGDAGGAGAGRPKKRKKKRPVAKQKKMAQEAAVVELSDDDDVVHVEGQDDDRSREGRPEQRSKVGATIKEQGLESELAGASAKAVVLRVTGSRGGLEAPDADAVEADLVGDADDNIMMRKLLRMPRYFSPEEEQSHRCFNCGQAGHIARDCSEEVKVRPCYVCGGLGHEGRDCPQKQLCYACGKANHTARECPTRLGGPDRLAGSSAAAGTSIICMRCGRPGHDARSCWRDYDPEDLELIQCYICKKMGHLSCIDVVANGPTQVSCYSCGCVGHTGEGCARARSAPVVCFLCGEEGHFARGCSAAGQRRKPWPVQNGYKHSAQGYAQPPVDLDRPAHWTASHGADRYEAVSSQGADYDRGGEPPWRWQHDKSEHGLREEDERRPGLRRFSDIGNGQPREGRRRAEEGRSRHKGSRESLSPHARRSHVHSGSAGRHGQDEHSKRHDEERSWKERRRRSEHAGDKSSTHYRWYQD
eukprot:SM000016S01838  [mRNA]  locus=s16:118045:121186:- [translate_table: standard]